MILFDYQHFSRQESSYRNNSIPQKRKCFSSIEIKIPWFLGKFVLVCHTKSFIILKYVSLIWIVSSFQPLPPCNIICQTESSPPPLLVYVEFNISNKKGTKKHNKSGMQITRWSKRNHLYIDNFILYNLLQINILWHFTSKRNRLASQISLHSKFSQFIAKVIILSPLKYHIGVLLKFLFVIGWFSKFNQPQQGKHNKKALNTSNYLALFPYFSCWTGVR